MKFTPEIRPASKFELSRAYTTDLVRSLGRLAFKKVRRTNSVVDTEYNAGEWGRILSERAWLRDPSLEEFLIGHVDKLRLAKVEGQIVEIAMNNYYRYRIGALSDLIARHVEETTSLLELGSGFGYNLFSLSLDPRWGTLRGLDIAPNGIEAGRQIARHYTLDDRISFDRIDLTDAVDSHFAELTGSTVFTYFCIEQVPYAVESVVENIIRARPSRVINIEPSVDMLQLSYPRDLSSHIYIKSMDYQTRLFKFLDTLDRKGVIRVLARERMAFAPSLRNDGLLYTWEPR